MADTTSQKGPGGFHGHEAIEAVSMGRTTPRALYRDAVHRMSEWEPALGAVVEQINYEPPTDGPLVGMVVGIKVHQDVAGYLNWFSLQAHGMDGEPASRDATVVARLRDAGATLACTTSAPFIGAPGGVTPQTRNPRWPDRISGGSSGGSASAVAAGIVHGGLGGDSGGSIRIPAASCGIVGLQTTRGVVPLTGAGGLTYSLDNVGPLACTVEDARLILHTIAGFDPDDPYSAETRPLANWNGEPLRIGIPSELVDQAMDHEIREVFEGIVEMLRDVGHRVEPVSLPTLGDSMELGPRTIGLVESGSIMQDSLGHALDTQPELAAAVRRSSRVSGPTAARAYHRVAMLRSEVRRTLAVWDVLLTPTLPCIVPSGSSAHVEADIDVGGVREARTSALTRLVNPWNLAAVPCGSQPVGRDSDGGPVSMQFIGPQFSDGKLLDIMQHLEGLTGGPWGTADPHGG